MQQTAILVTRIGACSTKFHTQNLLEILFVDGLLANIERNKDTMNLKIDFRRLLTLGYPGNEDVDNVSKV